MAIEAYVYDAIRTPRGKGKASGALYEVKPIDLLTNLMEAIKERNDLDTSRIEDLIVATGEPVNEQGQNIAKTAVTYSSWDNVTTGSQLHRYCAGGLDAVNIAAVAIIIAVCIEMGKDTFKSDYGSCSLNSANPISNSSISLALRSN